MEKQALDRLSEKLEALLFVSDQPMSLEYLSQISGEPAESVEKALTYLARRLKCHSGLKLAEIAQGYRLETKGEWMSDIDALVKDKKRARLTMAALETLALIAYKQPITGIEICEMRMITTVGSVLKGLLEKKLIRMVGRRDVVGRPMMYGTTRDFLLHFGLKNLDELPSLDEFKKSFTTQSLNPSDKALDDQEHPQEVTP